MAPQGRGEGDAPSGPAPLVSLQSHVSAPAPHAHNTTSSGASCSLRPRASAYAWAQVLFEANVRLQYSNDERLLLPALQVGPPGGHSRWQRSWGEGLLRPLLRSPPCSVCTGCTRHQSTRGCPACAPQDLAESVAADFPAEALLARPSILVGASAQLAGWHRDWSGRG